ncbi:hypothetical protein TELCIR_00007 [Teladorsagia circumcincta]|uniref:Uncharacterized protein n=1 Tax=Teladorsagia circumcincta TaxID=45464 RepID=A0A2G9V5T9_TELCI|nr:hypothetical protein TELCIR_00007 [Teladorsagia circumcincta]
MTCSYGTGEVKKGIVKNITKCVFEEINMEYNPYNLTWDDKLSGLALQEATHPGTIAPVIGWLIITTNMRFQKKDMRCLEVKVKLALKFGFRKEGYKVTALPKGTTYGCDGIVFAHMGKDHMRLEGGFVGAVARLVTLTRTMKYALSAPMSSTDAKYFEHRGNRVRSLGSDVIYGCKVF